MRYKDAAHRLTIEKKRRKKRQARKSIETFKQMKNPGVPRPEIGHDLNLPNGAYVFYAIESPYGYCGVKEGRLQLSYVKCWEPIWFVKRFGRIEADWAEGTRLHSTIIVEDKKITFIRNHWKD